MKENKVENLIWGGFAGIGALFVVIGLAICMFTFNYSNKVETIGTITEIYDYYRLLWARCGHVHCPICGKEISEMSVDQIIDIIFSHQEGGRLIVASPVSSST